MAAEIQPPDWVRGQVLLLPHVTCGGLDGVETMLHRGSFKQVRPKLNILLNFIYIHTYIHTVGDRQQYFVDVHTYVCVCICIYVL